MRRSISSVQINRWLPVITTILNILVVSILFMLGNCAKESEKEPDIDKICIAVDGYVLKIRYVSTDGHEFSYDFGTAGGVFFPIAETSTDFVYNGVNHHVVYSDVDFSVSTVTRADISIDGDNYSYPEDKCE